MKKLFTFAIAIFAVLSINAAELLNDTPATNKMIGWGTGFNKEATTVDGIQCYHISTTTAANPWDVQFAYDFTDAFEVDAKYNLKIKVKASAAYSMGVGFQNTSNYSSCGNFPNLALTTDWQELTTSVVCNAADGKRMVFSIGDFVGDIYIAYVILEKDEAAPVEKTEVVVFQDTPTDNKLGGWGTGFAREITNVDGKDCYKLSNSTSGNSWDVQFAYDFTEPFEVGQDYRIKMVAKASNAYNIPCQFQNPSNYSSCGDFPALKATTEWQELVVNGSCTAADGKRLVFSMGNFVGDIYIAQVTVCKLVDGPAPFVVEGDKYVAILEDKTVMEPIASIVGEGGVATNAVDGQSTIMVQSDNVLMTAVSAANPNDVPCEETDEFPGWTAGFKDAKWEAKNQGDIKFSYIQGSGNPAVVMGYEKKYSESQGTYSFTPAWTYYMSDGSNGLPKMGLYYKFAVAKDGVLKLDVWANKGNRRTFVVDDETMKALPYEVEGYINGQTEKIWDPTAKEGEGDSVSVKRWLSNAEIQALHDAAGKTDPEDAYIIGAGNQPFWGTISFPVQAGKTYWVFQHSSQIGFRGFELESAGEAYVVEGDKYVAILEDKTIMEPIASIVGEGGVATNAVDGQSTIMVKSDNVLMTAVSAANPNDVPCEETDEFPGWTAGFKDAKWEAKNQGDIKFSYIQGSGNPAVVMGYEKKYSESQGTYSFTPAWTYYMSDGSNGLPKMGLYYKFAVAKDGVLKLDVWANKGNRRTFVVDDETMKALPYEAEGYINGQNEKIWDPTAKEGEGDSVSVKRWLSNAEIQALHDAAGKTDPEDAYIIGAGNQPFWGTISFPVQAGKTYWVFQHSSQIGFRGFELTDGSAVLKGDANGDGQVNVNDITVIAAYILGNTPEKFVFDNADANSDGQINVNDITTTASIILGN